MAQAKRTQKFIKVETPLTTDGTNLAYGEDGKVGYKTTYLPASAQLEIERNSKNLPKHLQPKISSASQEEAEKASAGDTVAERSIELGEDNSVASLTASQKGTTFLNPKAGAVNATSAPENLSATTGETEKASQAGKTGAKS